MRMRTLWLRKIKNKDNFEDDAQKRNLFKEKKLFQG